MHKLAFLVAMLCLWPGLGRADVTIQVVYLKFEHKAAPVLSNLDPVPKDLGIAGARLGLSDNLTTGRFLNHDYSLEIISAPEDGDWTDAARAALATSRFVILDAPPEAQIAIADLPEAANAVLFNSSSYDAAIRDENCRANLLHSLPSNPMRSDALVQFLLRKRWTETVLISGSHAADQAFAEALKRSLDKFGLSLGGEKTWSFDADMRRNAAQEVPLFTQELGDYDVLLVADTLGDFGRYIAFNTWHPRPVAGSEGLQPVAWSRVVEQWGAAQMQNRFRDCRRPRHAPARLCRLGRDAGAWARP